MCNGLTGLPALPSSSRLGWDEIMGLRVEYLCDPADPASECWRFTPLAQDVEGAAILARDGGPDARDYLGAKSFRLVDDAGLVHLEEAIALMPRTTA